jgi:hypothetical protein
MKIQITEKYPNPKATTIVSSEKKRALPQRTVCIPSCIARAPAPNSPPVCCLSLDRHNPSWCLTLNWNDAAKRAALHRGLCEELKDILSTQDLPEDWSRYVALVKRRDMQYRARKAEAHRSSGQTKPAMMPTARNTSPNPTQNAPHPTSSGSGHFGSAPKDLSAARRQLSPEERQKRIDENRCLYSGGFNHMAWDCPNKPKTSVRPLRGAVAEMAQPEMSESSIPNPQSGNV